MTHLDEVRRSGSSDYYACNGAYENPYPIGTPEHNEYERGWMQSLKRNGAKLPGQSTEDAPTPNNEATSVNLYALAKGKR